MEAVSIEQIAEHMRGLSLEQLAVVHDVVLFLLASEEEWESNVDGGEAPHIRAGEALLSHDWNLPEEDEAWA